MFWGFISFQRTTFKKFIVMHANSSGGRKNVVLIFLVINFLSAFEEIKKLLLEDEIILLT